MSLLPTSYESFQSSNQGLVQNGGPWTPSYGSDTVHAQVTTETSSACGGVCLGAQVFPPDSESSYHVTYSTNISVTLANYGGATGLDFTWSYWPFFTSQSTAANTAMSIHSQVGGNSYDDSFPAVDWNTFWNGGHVWTTNTLTHSGSVSVGSDGTRGYVPISISFTITPNNHNEYMNHLIKGIQFSVKGATAGSPIVGTSASSVASQNSAATSTAQTSNQSGSSSSGSSSASASRSLVPVDPLHTTLGGSSSNSTVPVGGSSSNSSNSTSSTPVGLIAGATIGGIAVLAFLIFALFLFLRQKHKQANRHLAMPLIDYKGTPKDEQPAYLQDRDDTASEHGIANANQWVNLAKPLPPNIVEEARSRVPAWAATSGRSAPGQPQPPLVPAHMYAASGAATAAAVGEASAHSRNQSEAGNQSHSAVSGGGDGSGRERGGSSVDGSVPAWVTPMLGGADSQSETSSSQRQPFSSGALSSDSPGASHPISSRPTSIFSSNASTFDPPPLYPTSDLGHRGGSRAFTRSLLPSAPALAQFAALHRDQISQDLEARLQLAGWVPADDPSNLSAEEWRDDYGVTRLELMRLQRLYAQHQKQREQATLESVQEAEA